MHKYAIICRNTFSCNHRWKCFVHQLCSFGDWHFWRAKQLITTSLAMLQTQPSNFSAVYIFVVYILLDVSNLSRSPRSFLPGFLCIQLHPFPLQLDQLHCLCWIKPSPQSQATIYVLSVTFSLLKAFYMWPSSNQITFFHMFPVYLTWVLAKFSSHIRPAHLSRENLSCNQTKKYDYHYVAKINVCTGKRIKKITQMLNISSW